MEPAESNVLNGGKPGKQCVILAFVNLLSVNFIIMPHLDPRSWLDKLQSNICY